MKGRPSRRQAAIVVAVLAIVTAGLVLQDGLVSMRPFAPAEPAVALIGASTTDFLVVDGTEHLIDSTLIDGIAVTRSSETQGGFTKVTYAFLNTGPAREIRFVWRNQLDTAYDALNDRPLDQDFTIGDAEMRLSSGGTYKYFLTFADVAAAFGSLASVYQSSSRTLTVTSAPRTLAQGEELVMDPGGGAVPEVVLNGLANNSVLAEDAAAFLNFTATDDQDPLQAVRVFGSHLTTPNTEDLIYQNKSVTNNTPLAYNWSAAPWDADNNTLVLFHLDNRSDFNETQISILDFSGLVTGDYFNGTGFQAAGGAVPSIKGKIAGGFDFIGSGIRNRIFIVENDAKLRLTGPFTIEAWVYDNSSASQRTTRTITVKGSGTNKNWNLTVTDNPQVLRFETSSSGSAILANSATWTKGEWVHVAAVYNGSAGLLYINGALVATDTSASAPSVNQSNINIGDNGIQGSLWNGSIDEFVIHNRSLNASEIKDRFRLRNDTYFWYVEADDGTLKANSSTSRVYIGVKPSVPTLNTPANATNFSSVGTGLNVTVTDLDGTAPLVRIFGGNSSTGNPLRLLYQNTSVTSGAILLYNWSVPVLVNDTDAQVIYHFDNRSDLGENDSNVYDFTGKYNGTIKGNPIINMTSNRILAGHIELDGTGDFIHVNDCDFTCYKVKNTTYLFWLKSTDVSGFKTVAAAWAAAFTLGFAIYRNGTSLSVASDNAIPTITETDFFSADEWVHLAVVVYGNNTIDIYRNGELVHNASINAVTDVSAIENFKLGALVDAGTNAWNGWMDEVGIYNRSFTNLQVRDAYRLRDGDYYWYADAGDLDVSNMNQTLQRQFLLDAAVPNVTILSPVNITYPNRTVSFNASVLEANPETGLVQVSKAGSWATNYTLTNSSGVWGYTNTSMDDGTYTAQFILNDTASNRNNSQTVTFTVDATVPTITLISPANNSNVSNSQSISVNATVTDNNPTLLVKMFGSNITSLNASHLLYSKHHSNNTNATYAWSGPLLEADNTYLLLLHLDNNSAFGENAATVLDFASGGGVQNGSIAGGTGARFNVSGKIGGAYDSNATDGNAIDFGDQDTLIGSNITYLAWVHPRTVSGTHGIIDKSTSLQIPGKGLSIAQQGNKLLVDINESSVINVPGFFAANTWVHIAVVVGPTDITLYKNGLFNATGTYIRVDNNDLSLYVGNTHVSGTTQEFNGLIDEVAIINRTLDANQVMDAYRLRDGTYYWYVNASDNISTTQSSAFQFTLDGTPPQVTTTSPPSGNISNVTVNFNASVLEANPATGVVQVTPDGQGAINYTLANKSGVWGYTNLSMPDNRYVVAFMISDQNGNMNNTQTVTFTVDTTAPLITNITSNASGIISSTVINLTANITDANLPIVPANASGDAGATNVSLTKKEANKFSAETTPAALGCSSAGTCTVTVYFRDAAGNLGTGTGTIVLDTSVPNVTLLSPANQSYENSTVNFNVSVLEANPASGVLEVTQSDGAKTNYTLVNESGVWGYTNQSMAEGTYNARFYVNDTAGNMNASVNVTFTLAIFPKVTILSPVNTTYTNGTVSFNVSVLEQNPGSGLVQVSKAGSWATNYTLTNASGIWGYTNTSMGDGTYTARFFINDTNGNMNNTETVIFTIENLNVVACKTLTIANATYTLSQNLSTGQICFTVQANNITINLNGYNISGVPGGGYSGISITGYNRTTIKNGGIIDFGAHGIFADRAFSSNFTNLTINAVGGLRDDTYGASGILLLKSNSSTVTNTTVSGTSELLDLDYIGIEIESGSHILLQFNTLRNLVADLNEEGIAITGGSVNNSIIGNRLDSHTGWGIHLASASSNRVENNTVGNFTTGIFLDVAANNNTVYNNTLDSNDEGLDFLAGKNNNITLLRIVNSSGGSAIQIRTNIVNTNADNNSLTSVTVLTTNASFYDLDVSAAVNGTIYVDTFLANYTFQGSGGKATFRDTGEGEVTFLEPANGSGFNISADIAIANNMASINGTNNPGLNKSANITLFNMPQNFVQPEIFRNGEACPATICTNFTSLNAAIVIFNVTMAGNYTIREGDTNPPNVTLISPANQSYDNSTVNFNASVLEANPASGVLEITQAADNAKTNYTLANASGVWGYT
ncbi:MAG: right-handed parallel beta-helix repeat-containing protein, partial [Candidatus Aenigmarchaeota archaeon]|nr:right-handed parallel beta-helix repeat-containing protein [Candidatus Aenigmarchaeota archaeon]